MSIANSLPLPPALGIYPGPLLLAAGFGLLSAIAFSVPPLAKARAIPPASLLRDTVEPARQRLSFTAWPSPAARRWRSWR